LLNGFGFGRFVFVFIKIGFHIFTVLKLLQQPAKLFNQKIVEKQNFYTWQELVLISTCSSTLLRSFSVSAVP
jgi:hypothetical protein